jgi:hypothetical protein
LWNVEEEVVWCDNSTGVKVIGREIVVSIAQTIGKPVVKVLKRMSIKREQKTSHRDRFDKGAGISWSPNPKWI